MVALVKRVDNDLSFEKLFHPVALLDPSVEARYGGRLNSRLYDTIYYN